MAYTIQQIVDDARSILQDSVVPYRYEDDDLVTAINFAVYNIQRLRPDLYFGSYPITPSTLILTDNFPLSEWYVPLVAAFCAGWAELRDDEYTEDSRAALLLAALKPALQDG